MNRRPASARPGAELDGDLDERAHVVVGRAEVDEAGPEADLAVDRRGRHPDAAVVLEGAHEPRVDGVQVGVALPRWRNGTIESGGGPQSGSSRVVGDDEVVEQARLPEVVLDRVAERLRAVRPEGEPELQRPERPRVLERDVDHVARALVRDVRLLVRERLGRDPPGGGRAGRRTPSAGRATCGRRA